jgi:tRNA modification GTPase
LDLLTDQEITSIRQELETLNIKLIFLSAKQNIGVVKNQLLSFVNTGH